MIDVDQFEERAGIMEFMGGMSQFEAETRSAKEQGKSRKEMLDEIRMGHSAEQRDRGEAMARKQRAGAVPEVQRRSEEENRSVPKRHAQA